MNAAAREYPGRKCMEAKYCQQTKTWLVMRYNQLYMNIHGVGGHVACARVNVASTLPPGAAPCRSHVYTPLMAQLARNIARTERRTRCVTRVGTISSSGRRYRQAHFLSVKGDIFLMKHAQSRHNTARKWW